VSKVDEGTGDPRWRKSSSCTGADSTCVEVALDAVGVMVRDSKDAAGPILCFTSAEWRTFLAAVRLGEFDV
jgi:Domain of unknown function (DUF397)